MRFPRRKLFQATGAAAAVGIGYSGGRYAGTRSECYPVQTDSFVAGPEQEKSYKASLQRSQNWPRVRIAIIGVGLRGAILARQASLVPEIELKAFADPSKAWAEEMWSNSFNHLYKLPFFTGPEAHRKIYDLDLDAVIIATPWETHCNLAIMAMKSGKTAAIEVPSCLTVQEGYELLDTAQKTGQRFMMLENVNYFRTETAIWNLIREGYFGEPVAAEGAYIHDLSSSLYDKNRYRNGFWRANHHRIRNGNLYPTHPIGPIAKWFDIGGEDDFSELFSISTSSSILNDKTNIEHEQGDVNQSIIKTKNGKTINLTFSTTVPHWYTRKNSLLGTKASIEGWPDRINVIPGAGEHSSRLDSKEIEDLIHANKSKFWKDNIKNQREENLSHGGGDFYMLQKFAQNIINSRSFDISMKESVIWSIISHLTELSVKTGSSVKFPHIEFYENKERHEYWAP